VAGRQFVVVQATPLSADREGRRQVLIEASLWSVPSGGPIEAIDRAKRLGISEAPVWLADAPAGGVTFGAGSRVEQQPSVVTTEEDEATIQVGESTGDGVTANSTRIKVTPAYESDGALTLGFRLDHFDHGRLVHAVPPTQLSAPTGRVYIIESLPVR
jgi:hypothetical protein